MSVPDNTEQWADIPGYPGYQASNLGRIRSCRSINGRGGLRPTWRIKMQTCQKTGYWTVCLRDAEGKQRSHSVHALILRAFKGPPPPGLQVRHIRSNSKDDNRLANLAYGTAKENADDRVGHGTSPVGSRNPRAILDEAQVVEIRRLLAEGVRQTVLAKRHGVGKHVIWAIAHGRTWRQVN